MAYGIRFRRLIVLWLLSNAFGMAALAYPPLSSDQLARLDTAVDGQDHQEEAFSALVENARQFTGEIGDEAIRLHPDPVAMIENPASFRGDLCRLIGVIQQQTKLASPHEGIGEWFIRDDGGHPMLVYIIGAEGEIESAIAFRDGERVEITGRFYKRVEFTARDGVMRNYAAFVASRPRRVALNAAYSRGMLPVIVIPISIMLLVFAGLFIYVYRQRKQEREKSTRGRGGLPHEEAVVDGWVPLPDDPADALSAMRHRVDADNSPVEPPEPPEPPEPDQPA